MALIRLTNQSLTNITALPFDAGKILQIQYTQFTGTSITTVTSNSDSISFSDLTVNITPSSTSSIIKLEAQVYGEWSDQNAATNSSVFFLRDSTKLGATGGNNRTLGVAGMFTSYQVVDNGSTPEGSAIFQYFDTPSSTSQITYKVGIRTGSGSNPVFYLNRTVADLDDSSYERFISSISATEIAG